MIYIDNTQSPDAIASVTMARINDASEEILILAFPTTGHDAIRALLDPAQEIHDEQETTISRYIPRICYDIADMDGRTWPKSVCAAAAPGTIRRIIRLRRQRPSSNTLTQI